MLVPTLIFTKLTSRNTAILADICTEFCPKVKVKINLEQAMKAERGGRDVALLFFLTSALHGVDG